MKILKLIGLTGNLQMSFDGIINDNAYAISLGPETIENCLSDNIYIYDYIEKKAKELNIDMEIGLLENMHSIINVKTREEARLKYKILKEAIEKDGLKINIL